MNQTYKCPKCNGTGNLACYAGIAGGVCFSCRGAGIKVGVAPVPAVKFAVTAIEKTTSQRVTVFYVKAKNAAAALKKAVATLAGGSGYIADSAQVDA